jgi:hypothetical protein
LPIFTSDFFGETPSQKTPRRRAVDEGARRRCVGSRFRGRGYSPRAPARRIRRASTSTTGSSTTSSPGTILTITLLMLVDAGSNLGLALLQLTRFFVVFVLRNSPQALTSSWRLRPAASESAGWLADHRRRACGRRHRRGLGHRRAGPRGGECGARGHSRRAAFRLGAPTSCRTMTV